jgi:uncharacterized protein YgbK (DUF1537 family)
MTDTCPDDLLVAWYGDDFTGAAAVMEVLTFAGLPSVLFLAPPTAEALSRFPDARGIGIASTARAQTPDWMDRNLPLPFSWMRSTGAGICHYKTCSTFDSAPHIGSIGRAADIGQRIFAVPVIPMLVAAPPIRRYQAFGTLFAGSGPAVHRLDRHPVMAHHPVTPMEEADVTRHLSAQTAMPVAVLDLELLADAATSARRLEELLLSGPVILALDTIDEADLIRAGEILWTHRQRARFVLGSQGVEYALVAYFRHKGWLGPAPAMPKLKAVRHLPVVSGSVSPITAQQIAHAEAHGFEVIPLRLAELVSGPEGVASAIAHATEAAIACLNAGGSPLVCSARGPDDPAVAAFRDAQQRSDLGEMAANSIIGEALGAILEAILSRTGLDRAVVSGGDTSGAVTRQLGVQALTAFAATTPGAALFRAHRADHLPPIELALKGGQMGAPDLFRRLRDGHA